MKKIKKINGNTVSSIEYDFICENGKKNFQKLHIRNLDTANEFAKTGIATQLINMVLEETNPREIHVYPKACGYGKNHLNQEELLRFYKKFETPNRKVIFMNYYQEQ